MHLTLIMLKQLAKDLSGRDELWRRKLLVADHQHVMLDKGTVQYGTGFSVNILVQINPTHFGARVWGQWTDRVHHRAISSVFGLLCAASMATVAPASQSLAGRPSGRCEARLLVRQPTCIYNDFLGGRDRLLSRLRLS